MKGTKLNPALDVVEHINIYSKGRTPLGRFLSNFARYAFNHPDFGHFESVEGLWYWLSVPEHEPRRDQLREVWGWEAKKLGRELRGKDWVENDSFKEAIIKALEIKAECWIVDRYLKENSLPFVHYHVYNDKVIEPEEGKWILDFWNSKTEFRLI